MSATKLPSLLFSFTFVIFSFLYIPVIFSLSLPITLSRGLFLFKLFQPLSFHLFSLLFSLWYFLFFTFQLSLVFPCRSLSVVGHFLSTLFQPVSFHLFSLLLLSWYFLTTFLLPFIFSCLSLLVVSHFPSTLLQPLSFHLFSSRLCLGRRVSVPGWWAWRRDVMATAATQTSRAGSWGPAGVGAGGWTHEITRRTVKRRLSSMKKIGNTTTSVVERPCDH